MRGDLPRGPVAKLVTGSPFDISLYDFSPAGRTDWLRKFTRQDLKHLRIRVMGHLKRSSAKREKKFDVLLHLQVPTGYSYLQELNDLANHKSP